MTLYEILRKEFLELLLQKTTWGRNEIMNLFDQAAVKAMIKYAKQEGVNID
jgi:hypothetical protein